MVTGLDAFPERDWPSPLVHVAFQIMVALGGWLAALAAWALAARVRRRAWPTSRAFLRACALSTPLGFLAIETGWTVTEVGRQPWVIQGVLRTADAVTPMPHLWIPFGTFSLVYLGLAAAVVLILDRQIRATVADERAP